MALPYSSLRFQCFGFSCFLTKTKVFDTVGWKEETIAAIEHYEKCKEMSLEVCALHPLGPRTDKKKKNCVDRKQRLSLPSSTTDPICEFT